MFFNQDILYKDGALALVWMAGCEEFQPKDPKSRRTKNYRKMLQTDIESKCQIMLKYFPDMGSATGLTLKKASTLMKGLAIIYYAQMDDLARAMMEALLKMQAVTFRNMHAIDLINEQPNRRQMLQMKVQAYGFGSLENFEDVFDMNYSPRCFEVNLESGGGDGSGTGSSTEPLAVQELSRKKRRTHEEPGVDDNYVMRLLQEIEKKDPRAHCMIEVIEGPQATGEFNAFGEGMGFDDFMESEMETGIVRLPEMVRNQLLISPSRRQGTADPDDGEGRHGTTAKRRRPSNSSESNLNPVDEIGPPDVNGPIEMGGAEEEQVENGFRLQLEVLESQPINRGGQQQRRRRRLQIDEEIEISVAEIYKQIQNQRRPLDYDALSLEIKRRSQINRHTTRGLDFILASGRGVADYVKSVNQNAPQRENRQQIPVPAVEVPPEQPNAEDARQAQGSSLAPLPVSNVGGSVVRSPLRPIVEEAFCQPDFEVLETLVGPATPMQLDDGDERGTTFKDLFPPEKNLRKSAATGFFRLLELQKQEKVKLEQKEWFGTIYVKKLAGTDATDN